VFSRSIRRPCLHAVLRRHCARLSLFPPQAHDYKGRRSSTIGAEKASNPRLTKPLAEFVDLMANLNLPYPRKIDASLPANLACGIF